LPENACEPFKPGRKKVPCRKSTRASLLCQEAAAAAIPEFIGSVQLASCGHLDGINSAADQLNSESADVLDYQAAEDLARLE
jgi:hypothetical protein